MTAENKINFTYSPGVTQKTFIIAEIGQNHQGNLEIAKKMIQIAKDCGCDCVKFQKSCLEEKFNKAALLQQYAGPNSWALTYGDHKKYLEFSNKQFLELQSFSNKLGIIFSASAMDIESLRFLVSIKVPFIKIGSGDANNLILIEEAASTNIPLIISTGMQNLTTVKKIYQTVTKYHKNFALLHCVSAYPTPIEDVNLSVITLYQKEFPDISIGYSGHEYGIHITQAAVALGARVIERHITLDRTQKGSDHKCSLEPCELQMLVKNVREIEVAIGVPNKVLQESEKACHEKLGKTIVCCKHLKRGVTLTKEDLKIKVAIPRGIDAIHFENILGKILKIDMKEDESLTENCLL